MDSRSRVGQWPAAAAAIFAGSAIGTTFVQGPNTSVGLRGAPRQSAAAFASASCPSSFGQASAWAGAGAVGVAVAAASNRRKMALAAEADAKKVVKKDEPPPPPPFDPSKEPGVTLPLMYFNPLGFSKVGDKEGFDKLRAAELKHGRVAMMAAVGAVAQSKIKFPGFEDVPTNLSCVLTPPATYGLVALTLLCGAIEIFVWPQDPNKEPGNFGDPAGLGQYNNEWRNRELNNGRFAMVAIFSIVVTDLITKKDAVQQIWTPVANLPVE